jgi:hypothetical protein
MGKKELITIKSTDPQDFSAGGDIKCNVNSLLISN